jgi:CheY-like chemotaxis protein
VPNRTAKTILICEDDDNLRQLIRVVIGAGYRIVEAGDGDEALALASEHQPDLIVLDLMMPGMSGFDVLRRLRVDVRVDGTHIVVMSAWPNAKEAAGGRCRQVHPEAVRAGRADESSSRCWQGGQMKSMRLSTRIIAASVVLAVLVAGVFAVLIYAVVTLDNARERRRPRRTSDFAGRAREARHRS